jgi:hypothetical protein
MMAAKNTQLARLLDVATRGSRMTRGSSSEGTGVSVGGFARRSRSATEIHAGVTSRLVQPPLCTYVLPLKSSQPANDAEFTDYLRNISYFCELIIVDGSPSQVFDAHQIAWGEFALHIRPVSITLMGKVGGVMTGVNRASCDKVIIADDDVRYGAELADLVHRLDDADVVRPQNYFFPLPWHAAWDSGRILLNRMSGGDWPGTLAIRSSALIEAGGYAGDVMFENYELVQSICDIGGRHKLAADIFVRRLPPSSSQFFSQRIRQAYDELARPLRLVPFLLIGPLTLSLVLCRRWQWLARATLATSVGTVIIAESGRRRAGAGAYFPFRCSLMSPFWVAERAICSWAALLAWARGGVLYGGRRLRRPATRFKRRPRQTLTA